MSNLIKSGKVIDLGIPVSVGVAYNFNSKSVANELSESIKKAGPIIEEQVNTEITRPRSPEEVANKLVEDARIKANEYFESEMKKAYDEGILKANEEARGIIENAKAEREKILADVLKMKENAVEEYKNEVKSAEKDLLELSLDIVEKIINYEVDRSDNYVLGIVKDALDKVANKKDVILKLSTADYYTVMSNKKELVASVKGFGEIEIIQDESLDPGTCIVDTPLGVIDGSIQVRMDNIQKEVMRMLNEQ